MLEPDTQVNAELGRIGCVASIKGSKITLDIASDNGPVAVRVTVGTFVGIHAGTADLVGIITTLASSTNGEVRWGGAHAAIDLLGEIRPDESGTRLFRRGISCHPAIGDAARVLPGTDLQLVYQVAAANTVSIGTLYQDASMPACVKVDDLLQRRS